MTTSKQAMRKMQRNATKEEPGRWRRPGIVHRKANGGNGAGGRSGELEPNGSNKREWLQPKLLPNGLAPVEAFSKRFMPEALGAWIDDISNRLQCPPDYVGVTAVTALGAVVGRRVGIRPQTKTDWMEIPNQWGCFIGRPGNAEVSGNERGAQADPPFRGRGCQGE